MKIVIGSDKSGFFLKEQIVAYLSENQYEFTDIGTQDIEHAMPYYTVASLAAERIRSGEYDRGILICGTGMGMAVVANKFKNVYAACCESVYAAEKCRAINDANILTMGGWIIAPELGLVMVQKFLTTEFTEGLEPWRKDFLVKAKEQVKKIEESECQ